MDTPTIALTLVRCLILLVLLGQKYYFPMRKCCGCRKRSQDDTSPLINAPHSHSPEWLPGLFDNGSKYGLDGIWMYRRMVFLMVIFLAIGFLSYIQSNSKFMLEFALGTCVTSCASIIFLAITSLLLKVFQRNSMINEMKLQGNEQVLDVCCGSGFMLNGIAPRLAPGQGRLIGLDKFHHHSPQQTIDNLAKMNNSDKVQLIAGEPCNLSQFQDNSFDCISINMLMVKLNSQERMIAFSEFRRILRPGGIVVSGEFCFGAHMARGDLEEAGFTSITTNFPLFYLFLPVFVTTARKPLHASEQPDGSHSWKYYALIPGQFLSLLPWIAVYFAVELIPVNKLLDLL